MRASATIRLALCAAAFALSLGTASAASITFAPPNDFARFDNIDAEDANMTQADFDRIIDEVVALYAPVVAAHGGNLVSFKEWSDPTVNAFANQAGADWELHMFGGMARRPEATADGFAMVVCHELGHHLGGYPFYDNGEWPANEGQSDYFATLACARRLWGPRTAENAAVRSHTPLAVRTACNGVTDNRDEQNLCYRSILAGQSLGNLLAVLGGTPQPRLDTPNLSEVEVTDPTHPEAQCRFDTYVAGALCSANFAPEVIPGRSHADGQDSVGAEAVAAASSCSRVNGEAIGQRPRCWFAPKMRLALDLAALQFTVIGGNNNGVVDPGESVEVTAPLINTFPFAVGGATASVGTLRSDISIESDSMVYGTLAPSASTAPSGPIAFTVAPTAACGAKVHAPVSIVSLAGRDKSAFEFRIGRLAALTTQVGSGSGTPIPDADHTGITGTVDLPMSPNIIAALDVTVNITHTFIGDIGLVLIDPNGHQTLIKQVGEGGDADDLHQTYTVDVTGNVAGTWTLNVVDAFAQDVGTLDSWAVTPQQAICE